MSIWSVLITCSIKSQGMFSVCCSNYIIRILIQAKILTFDILNCAETCPENSFSFSLNQINSY